jgi:intracellular sulfur oxidation DsrE/DsrF family protein
MASRVARKLLIHISDRDKWSLALRLVQSLTDNLSEENCQVVMVADVFAGGICLACHRQLREQMEALSAAGHRILVCEESLRALNLRPENLPEFAVLITNSLVEISRILEEGYQYLKL